MEPQELFKVVLLKEAFEFLKSLDPKASDKITQDIEKSKYFPDATLFKKLSGSDIWEFRTLYNGIAYRLLAFWDKEENKLVVATHGFIKKKQKTPLKEINRALQLRQQYFDNKHKQ